MFNAGLANGTRRDVRWCSSRRGRHKRTKAEDTHDPPGSLTLKQRSPRQCGPGQKKEGQASEQQKKRVQKQMHAHAGNGRLTGATGKGSLCSQWCGSRWTSVGRNSDHTQNQSAMIHDGPKWKSEDVKLLEKEARGRRSSCYPPDASAWVPGALQAGTKGSQSDQQRRPKKREFQSCLWRAFSPCVKMHFPPELSQVHGILC